MSDHITELEANGYFVFDEEQSAKLVELLQYSRAMLREAGTYDLLTKEITAFLKEVGHE